ncbi:MAG: tetratricopeptide repeat protein [Longimicrobiales bacterium]
MTPVWTRLKERKVVQWCFGYLAGAWVLLQVLGLIADAFAWQGRVMQAVIVLLAVGFFAVLIVAYYHGERGDQRVHAPELVMLAVVALVGLPLVYLVSRPKRVDALDAAPLPVITEKSIAVLPFTTFTTDEQSTAFAAGVQDAILTLLAKVGDLKVISRTSTLQYATGSHDTRAISTALGAKSIVEGSVQRSGNNIQVQAQLIDGATDAHIWAQTYKGELTDLFKIQSQIATKIAAELQARLTTEERSVLGVAPTKNAEAYELYLSAVEYTQRPGFLKEDLTAAARQLRNAIRFDSQFALAYAALSWVEGALIWYKRDNDPAHWVAQHAFADTALAINPDLPEAHRAKAIAYYWGDANYAAAIRELEIARKGLPNDAELISYMAYIKRRQGRWPEAEATLLQAIEIDPRNSRTWAQLCSMQQQQFKTAAAVASCKRALEIAPTNYNAAEWSANAYLRHTGKLDELRRVLADTLLAATSDANRAFDMYRLATYTRDWKRGLEVVKENPRGFSNQTRFIPAALATARFYAIAGDSARARAYFEAARIVTDSALRASPQDARNMMAMAYVMAGLRNKVEAVRMARAGVAANPPTRDAVWAQLYMEDAAGVFSQLGMPDEAMGLLDGIVARMGGVSPSELRIDPVWDPIRGDPRFKKLLIRKPGG